MQSIKFQLLPDWELQSLFRKKVYLTLIRYPTLIIGTLTVPSVYLIRVGFLIRVKHTFLQKSDCSSQSGRSWNLTLCMIGNYIKYKKLVMKKFGFFLLAAFYTLTCTGDFHKNGDKFHNLIVMS